MAAPGRRLARGRWADVFELGRGRVVKHYRDPATASMAAFEAAVMEHARAAGVPVPEVYEVRGCDLVLERVNGPTMLQALARGLHQMAGHARTLAGLHRLVHAVAAPPGLPRPFGAGGTLLHLDLHPDNVILSASGPVLIDWQGAAAGPGAADVAHTWLLVYTSTVPGPPLQRIAASAGQRAFARCFLGQVDAAAARQQLAAVAARRLQDPTLLAAEVVRIRRVLRHLERKPGRRGRR